VAQALRLPFVNPKEEDESARGRRVQGPAFFEVLAGAAHLHFHRRDGNALVGGMNTTATPNKSTALALDQKTNQGVDKYFGSITSLLVAGVNITPEVLKAIFQDDIDQTNALDTLEAQVKQQRSKQKAARKKATGMRQNLRTYILGSYGTSALQMLQDFGFTRPSPAAVGRRRRARRRRSCRPMPPA
jgi:hypothetical protein